MKNNYVNTYGIDKDTVITDEVVLSICLRDSGTKMKSGINTVKWKEQHPELANYIENRYNDSDNMLETLYRMKYNIDVRPVCLFCGGRLIFRKFTLGFPKHCSVTCLNKDKEHIEKIKLTCTKKYGGPNAMCSDEIKAKSRQTCLERYGVEFSLQAKEVRNKGKQTCLKKFGKESYGQFGSKEYNELILERYGVENVFLSEIIKAKMKLTNLQKYGVEYVSQSESIKTKVLETNLERYGVPCVMQSKEIKLKVLETTKLRYGVEYISQSEYYKEKVKLTCLERYGVEYVSQSAQAKAKVKQTCLDKYGVEHVLQNPIYNKKVLDTKRKNKTFNTSKVESEFGEYLKSKYTVKKLFKTDLYPFNCDFYIEELDLYIELQGTWTHGKHRYNPEDPKDIEKLQFWQSKGTPFYESAIHTWTVRDPLKFETAEKNNLKYLAIYSCKLKDCVKQFEDYINNLN